MISFKKIITLGLVAIGVTATASLFSANGNPLAGVFGVETTTPVSISNSVTDSSNYSSLTYEHNPYVHLNFTYVKAGGTVGTIKAHSTITKTEASYGLQSITVNFSSGTLTAQTWYEEGDLVKRNYTLSSGVTTYVDGNYFRLTAGNADVTIDSIDVNSQCLTPTSKPATSADIASYSSVTLEEDLTNKEHYWVLNGSLKSSSTYLSNDIKIYDGSKELAIDEVYLEGSSFQIKANIFKSAKSLGTDLFYPHMKINGQNVNASGGTSGDIKVATYNNIATSSGKTETSHGSVNTYKRNTYTAKSAWGMPCLSIDLIQPKFEMNNTVVSTSMHWGKRASTGRSDLTWAWSYAVTVVQSNKYFNFRDSNNSSGNDNSTIEFYDWVSDHVHIATVKESYVNQIINKDGETYQVIDLHLDLCTIIIHYYKNKCTNFRGTGKDTVLFSYSVKKAKNAGLLVDHQGPNDQALTLDNTKNISDWTYYQAIPDGQNGFWIAGHSTGRGELPKIIIQRKKAGLGMYA